MQKTTANKLIPFITLLLVASIFLSNPTTASADDVEPNNVISEATEIWPGYYSGNNQSDDDWYRIWVNHNEILEIWLVYNASEGILDMGLFNENETSLVNASGDHLSWNNFNSGQYLYFRISGPNFNQWYDLDIYIFSDSYEDNDFYWDPAFLVLDFYGNDLISADNDYYEFILMPGDYVDVNVWCTSWINITLAQIDRNTGAWIQSDSSTDDGLLYLYIHSSVNDNYTIGIFGDFIGEHYDLGIYLYSVSTDDWMEPNDELNQAWDLPFGWTNGLVQFDEDWFRIWMEPNDDLHIDINYDYPYTTLNLTLFDEYETELAWNGWVQSLDWTNNAAYGQYVYLRVIGPSVGDWYDLNVLMNGQGSGDDWAEENDDYQNYYYLGPGYYGSLFNFDDDYFAVDLKANDTLKVWVHSSAAYWQRLEWVDEFDGHALLSDESWEDGDLYLEIYADHDGKYILAVIGENMGEWYDLQIEIERDSSSTVKPTDDPTGTNDPTGTDDPSDPDNPFGDFDLSNIPGYPIEMVGGIMLVALIAIIIPIRKKFHH